MDAPRPPAPQAGSVSLASELRALVLIAAACASVAVAACGGETHTLRSLAPHVQLQVAAPADGSTVRAASVDVRGTVSPATADVRVLGLRARVSGGEFAIVVALDPGVNVIDVAATARGRSPALTAVRVTREQRVTVPDLAGMSLDEARLASAPLGLALVASSRGDLLDLLLRRSQRVCEQQPRAGAKVRRGATVKVTVAGSC